MSVALTIPYAYARAQGIAAVGDEGAAVHVILAPQVSVEAIAEARRLLGKPLRTERVSSEQFAVALAQAYAQSSALAERAASLPAAQNSNAKPDPSSADDLLTVAASDGPAVNAVNQLFVAALNAGASDIHIEPFEHAARARFRVDGQLRDVPESLADISALHAAMVARLKVMAQLDLAERRLPQDGRLSVNLGGRNVDVRVSTLPSAFGERVVLRLLDKTTARLDLNALGLSKSLHVQFAEMLSAPHGIVLVTGPTGSGKTTTLYAALGELATRERNVMTVEDPIEYAIHGIAQTAVHPAIGLTFARCLRAILRQDPDVIMIGEIRDAETAQIAVQASLTGHLVLATLHTNDAASAVTRLADMGVEPYLLASALTGVMAQRLVRKLCNECKIPAEIPAAQNSPQTYAPRGCAKCGATGYLGRTGVYELMAIDATLREHIHAGASLADISAAAQAQGMATMQADAQRWVDNGTTSRAEVLRVATERA